MSPSITLLIVVLAGCSSPGQTDRPRIGSYAEMCDLHSLPLPKDWTAGQASGYDRKGGYYDSGNFLRIEPDRHYVLMDEEGAGAIHRMWFTRKSEREPYMLLIYLDGADEPSIRMTIDALTSSKLIPFVSPLVGQEALARYCYVPIGFRTGCKVVLVPMSPDEDYNWRENSDGEKIPHVYYQISYRKVDQPERIEPFRWKLASGEASLQKRVCQLWQRAGQSVWEDNDSFREQKCRVMVEPGAAEVLWTREGAGTVYEFLVAMHDKPPRLDGLDLEMTWDHASRPQVSVPLSSFFAILHSAQKARGLWMGRGQMGAYSYFPMPFRERAEIRLRSQSEHAFTMEATVRYVEAPPAEDAMHFYARAYAYAPPLPEGDYTILATEGRGHFVGMMLDVPGNMEGDDKFYVDGEPFPSIHGTGTEDYFNFAWGFGHKASLPLHGIEPTCYRIHFPGVVPFRKNLRVTCEHGHGNGDTKNRYAGIVWYYQKGHEGMR